MGVCSFFPIGLAICNEVGKEDHLRNKQNMWDKCVSSAEQRYKFVVESSKVFTYAGAHKFFWPLHGCRARLFVCSGIRCAGIRIFCCSCLNRTQQTKKAVVNQKQTWRSCSLRCSSPHPWKSQAGVHPLPLSKKSLNKKWESRIYIKTYRHQINTLLKPIRNKTFPEMTGEGGGEKCKEKI